MEYPARADLKSGRIEYKHLQCEKNMYSWTSQAAEPITSTSEAAARHPALDLWSFAIEGTQEG
jgi:hypothetical protein